MIMSFRFKNCSLGQLITSLRGIYKYEFPHLVAHVVWVPKSKHVDTFSI